ncbi:MAG TPA: RNA polymerase sigma factor [Steroidobacteraceae bacterium]|nr:RNA polymerase sigma factor [Steroidobacteraceae bacterium]
MTRLVEIAVPDEVRERACAGEESAQGLIYAAVAAPTFALIRRLIGNRSASEDIFQDTMMILFERLGEFRQEAPLGAWLRQIAISRCLMYLRSPWRRARLRLEWDTPQGACGAGPTVTALPPEAIDIERALAALAPTARAVIWMYEVEGYSHAEIAQAFGRSVSFSKSQLARAHLKLRAWFEPQGTRPTCTLS